MENKRTLEELRAMQALPLEQKIKMSKERIKEWYEHYDGAVYVSFSGGKDSTVLLHLVRGLYPDVEAVFSDTGLEYPEIRDFVKQQDNVTILKPERNFRQVIIEYGYPVPSKEISRKIYYYKRGSEWATKYFDDSLTYNGVKSRYAVSSRWKRLIDAPFEVSPFCCDWMKKRPFRQYEKESQKKPFIGTLAEESEVRSHAWERTGCNAFDSKKPHSNPLSFWTEQDILTYLLTNYRYAPYTGKSSRRAVS